jgi:hypothetical protein
MFQSYPASDYDDPKSALASYVEVLLDFSDRIVDHVTSNRTGIQRRIKFPPRLAELVQACDEAATHFDRFDRLTRKPPKEIEPPREARPTREEMLAKYGPNYGVPDVTDERIGTKSIPTPSWDTIVATYSADPSRIDALANSPFMTRKGKPL